MTEKAEALIAEMRERAEHPATGSNVAQCLREGARALEEANARLAAQPVLDERKVAEQLGCHEPIFRDGQYAGRCICGHEHPSYSGWRLHRTRALCEAAKRGELT